MKQTDVLLWKSEENMDLSRIYLDLLQKNLCFDEVLFLHHFLFR